MTGLEWTAYSRRWARLSRRLTPSIPKKEMLAVMSWMKPLRNRTCWVHWQDATERWLGPIAGECVTSWKRNFRDTLTHHTDQVLSWSVVNILSLNRPQMMSTLDMPVWWCNWFFGSCPEAGGQGSVMQALNNIDTPTSHYRACRMEWTIHQSENSKLNRWCKKAKKGKSEQFPFVMCM